MTLSNPLIAQSLDNPQPPPININQQLSSSINIIQIENLPTEKPENLTTNSNQTYQAFTLCVALEDDEGCQEELYFKDLKSNLIYQIQGVPLPWRPFSNLLWLSEDILQFERWSQPHYGMKYTVNVKERKLLSETEIQD